MASWVRDGFEEYRRRMPACLMLELVEVPLAQGASTGNAAVVRRQDATRLMARLAARDFVVALDERGESWSSAELARCLARWMQVHDGVTLVVGGPQGLDETVRRRANACWSLSPLTFPHGLVRMIVAEQLYRAWTILDGHPYHKE